MVEWKQVDSARKDMIEQRIELLARLLNDNDVNYGIISPPLSRTTVQPPRYPQQCPDELALGDCFVMANNIVKTVLLLQKAGLVHKAIRSDNVLFCDNADYANFRMVDFEYSRQATSVQQTEGMTDDLEPTCVAAPTSRAGSTTRVGRHLSPQNMTLTASGQTS
jgi:hypothetical protein